MLATKSSGLRALSNLSSPASTTTATPSTPKEAAVSPILHQVLSAPQHRNHHISKKHGKPHALHRANEHRESDNTSSARSKRRGTLKAMVTLEVLLTESTHPG